MKRRGFLLPFAALAGAALLVAGGSTRMSAAAFSSSLTVTGSSVTVDRLSNHFQVTPGPLASGDVDSLAIDLGLVDSPGAVSDVFTVENVSAESRTATLTLQGPSQVASVAFAASGTASVTLAPGASSTVSVTTSPTVAGHGAGALRLALGGSSWLYRDYPLTLDAAPAAPASLNATAQSGGRIALSWAASTTTEPAGYDVYRSTGGSYTKLNGSPLSATTYTDTATSEGTTYTYMARTVSTGSPALESVDSPLAVAIADATAPTLPSAVALANGGGQGNAYINLGNRASLSVAVTLPASSLASDTLTVTVSNGAQSVSASAPATAGAGTVTISGLDATSLADGTVTLAATVSDAAGNASAARSSTAPKDTVAPGVPTATYVDNRNAADEIAGSAETNAAVSAAQTAPVASGPYTGAAGASGAYALTVAQTNGRMNAPVTVTYLVTAADAAGNTSAVYTLTAVDRR